MILEGSNIREFVPSKKQVLLSCVISLVPEQGFGYVLDCEICDSRQRTRAGHGKQTTFDEAEYKVD